MHERLAISLLGLSLTLVGTGCPGDDSPSDGTTTATDGTTGGGSATDSVDDGTTSNGSATDSAEDDGTSTGPGATTVVDEGTTAGDDATDSTGPGGACQVWEITYDMEGSVFEISDTPFGAGDQVNTVTMPYDQDDHVGPGNFVLRFQDVDGAPGGLAAMVSHEMTLEFVVDGATTVTTTLMATAGPDECGVTQGMVEDTTVAWMPSAIVGHHNVGQILCEGALCGAGGLPNGEPVPVDDMEDQPINDFVFGDDFSTFTMDTIVVQMDAQSTSSWTYAAVETSRELIDAPECLCP